MGGPVKISVMDLHQDACNISRQVKETDFVAVKRDERIYAELCRMILTVNLHTGSLSEVCCYNGRIGCW